MIHLSKAFSMRSKVRGDGDVAPCPWHAADLLSSHREEVAQEIHSCKADVLSKIALVLPMARPNTVVGV
jgi:hypothetical protein